jgi:2-polyprenyl-6-hydroxyphenyl methylase/3-demethylubiquinone-9 3-methyltransferase
MEQTSQNLTDAAAWNWHWRRGRSGALPRRINPNVHWSGRLLRRAAFTASARNAFELGCAPGAWLAFCAHRLGLAVSGCDASATGIRVARALLKSAGVSDAGVLEADVFALPSTLQGRYDLVYSFGLIEHFSDLSGILRAHAVACRPGGVVLVTAPNLRGASGAIYRRASTKLLASHRIVTPAQLRSSARSAGLVPIALGYGGPLSAFVLLDRTDGPARRAAGWLACAALGWGTLPATSERFAGWAWMLAERKGP